MANCGLGHPSCICNSRRQLLNPPRKIIGTINPTTPNLTRCCPGNPAANLDEARAAAHCGRHAPDTILEMTSWQQFGTTHHGRPIWPQILPRTRHARTYHDSNALEKVLRRELTPK